MRVKMLFCKFSMYISRTMFNRGPAAEFRVETTTIYNLPMARWQSVAVSRFFCQISLSDLSVRREASRWSQSYRGHGNKQLIFSNPETDDLFSEELR